MKAYVSCEIVQAEPMTLHCFNARQNRCVTQENQEGYRVVHSGGVILWRPKAVFEAENREVSPGEKGLISPPANPDPANCVNHKDEYAG